MDKTTDSNDTPKRRLEDHHPAATIAWDKPGAPAVPAPGPGQSCIALRHVASMVVGAAGVSVFPTPAAAHLEPGHYMLSAPGAQLAGKAADTDSARAAEAAQPASTSVERLTTEDIDIIWQGMPGGPAAWLKAWGYQQFAKAVEDEVFQRAVEASRPAATSGEAPDLQQLKALALAATPGERELDPADMAHVTDDGYHTIRASQGYPDAGFSISGCISTEDAAFMAAASPAVVLDLIARIDRAERALIRAGFVDHGAQEWKPPVGPAPRFIEVPASIESAAAPAPTDALRKAVREMTAMLEEREWAEHVSVDPDVAALESAITELVGLYEQARAKQVPVPATASGDDLPTVGELESVWEMHAGHPADFAADVLERWGGWPQGILGQGGSLDRAAVSAATKPTADLSASGLLKLWEQAQTDATETMPAPFQFARSLLATKPAAQADQAIIGKLLDRFSEIEHLWGLNEPGALVRHRDVFNLIVAVGKAAAAPLPAAQAVPEGWKLVPVEPDENMIYEGGIGRRDQMVDAPAVYRAMLAAAPAAPLSADAAQEQALTRDECDLALRWLDVTRLYAFAEPEDDALADKLNKIRAGAEGAA